MAAISVTACRNIQFLEVFSELRRRGGIASPFRRLKQDGRNAPKPNVCWDARALAGASGTQISGAGAGVRFRITPPGVFVTPRIGACLAAERPLAPESFGLPFGLYA